MIKIKIHSNVDVITNMKPIKIKIHSTVSEITNSSTVIFTYQDSIEDVKALVEEIIKISGRENLTADDIFYYGVFCEDDTYINIINDWEDYFDDFEKPNDFPELTEHWNGNKNLFRAQQQAQTKWVTDLETSILKGEIEKPEWMVKIQEMESSQYYQYDRLLHILPKNEEYKDLADKLINFLNSPTHEATRDG